VLESAGCGRLLTGAGAVPGGHRFGRLDTGQAQEIRLRVYRFLARYLKPDHLFGSVADLHAAGCR
jgi:hypothetical protein